MSEAEEFGRNAAAAARLVMAVVLLAVAVGIIVSFLSDRGALQIRMERAEQKIEQLQR